MRKAAPNAEKAFILTKIPVNNAQIAVTNVLIALYAFTVLLLITDITISYKEPAINAPGNATNVKIKRAAFLAGKAATWKIIVALSALPIA